MVNRGNEPSESVYKRLLESADELSFNPRKQIDWTASATPGKYGLPPELSTLYGTPLWDRMSEDERINLTRHEVSGIMGFAIYLEISLQQIFLRDQFGNDPAKSEFQFALNELADESEHSIMFAKAAEKMAGTVHIPSRANLKWFWGTKTFSFGKWPYGVILSGEEILDVLQRAFEADDRVDPFIRSTSHIHIIEEARHMKFAREQLRKEVEKLNTFQRNQYAFFIAVGGHILGKCLINDRVYKAAGIDPKEARAAINKSSHFKTNLKSAAAPLMEFISEIGLMTPMARAIYRKSNLF